MLEMNSELVSVIVPVFNIEEYLPKCLESIYNQTYKNLEIILVDDGSTDSSGDLCDEYADRDSRARVIHQQNRGLWAARNAGQDIARGDYFFFPDGDDYFHRDLLHLLYDAINIDPKQDLAIVREKRVWGNDEDTQSIVNPKIICRTRDGLIRGLLSKGDDRFYVYMWNKLYRRELVEDIRSRNYSRSQDYDFNLRVFLNVSRAILIDNDLYYWVQRPGSLTKAHGAAMMMYSCRSNILFRNYMDLAGDNIRYRHLLLARLYKTMVFCKGASLSSNSYSIIREQCREYERSTRRAYLSGEGIGLVEKLGCLTLIHFPHLARLLMRITGNL